MPFHLGCCAVAVVVAVIIIVKVIITIVFIGMTTAAGTECHIPAFSKFQWLQEGDL